MQLLFTIKDLVALYYAPYLKFLDPPKDVLLFSLLVIWLTLSSASKNDKASLVTQIQQPLCNTGSSTVLYKTLHHYHVAVSFVKKRFSFSVFQSHWRLQYGIQLKFFTHYACLLSIKIFDVQNLYECFTFCICVMLRSLLSHGPQQEVRGTDQNVLQDF